MHTYLGEKPKEEKEKRKEVELAGVAKTIFSKQRFCTCADFLQKDRPENVLSGIGRTNFYPGMYDKNEKPEEKTGKQVMISLNMNCIL
jgi:hypothetical protein